MENHISTLWKGGNTFESNNMSGYSLTIDSDEPAPGQAYFRPKNLMLSALAGCTGLDVVSLFNKMKLNVDEFTIEIKAQLTEEHPKYYHKVHVVYHFHGSELNEERLKRCVDLSAEKYCGVAEMFRQFSELTYAIEYHQS
jgi:putative redox protein